MAGAAGGLLALTDGPTQQEKDRLDIFHKLFLVARKDELHRAPFVPNHSPPRILDLGTGTGIWAIEMAEYVSPWNTSPVSLFLPAFVGFDANLRSPVWQQVPRSRGQTSGDM